MSITQLIKLRLTSSFIFILTLSTATMALEPLTGAIGEWSPYMSEKLKNNGVIIHALDKILDDAGYETTWFYFPWKRSYNNVVTGKNDISAAWSYSEERSKEVLFTDTIFNSSTVLFHRKDLNFNWEKVSDLGQYSIGGAVGYYYGEQMDAAEKDGVINIERIPDERKNFRKLAAGRIDLVIMNLDVGYALLYDLFPPQIAATITSHNKKLVDNHLRMIVSNQIPNGSIIVERFNESLAKFRETIDMMLEESRQGAYLLPKN